MRGRWSYCKSMRKGSIRTKGEEVAVWIPTHAFVIVVFLTVLTNLIR